MYVTPKRKPFWGIGKWKCLGDKDMRTTARSSDDSFITTIIKVHKISYILPI